VGKFGWKRKPKNKKELETGKRKREKKKVKDRKKYIEKEKKLVRERESVNEIEKAKKESEMWERKKCRADDFFFLFFLSQQM
jgi:hypothetical protein